MPRKTSDYDPRSDGARCDDCDLHERIPVRSEIRVGAKLLIVAEAPGVQEEIEGKPFVGASGRELDQTLSGCGLRRSDVSLSNTICCRPPGRSFNEYLRRLSKRNAKRKRNGEAPIPSPIDCCSERLRREIAAAPALLLLGAKASEAVAKMRGEESLKKVRGYPIEVLGKPTVATFHPAFILRSRRWTHTFRADVAKAIRHASGRLQWTSPEMVLDPSIGELDAALERLATGLVAVDTETDGLDPESVNLRCVGLGSADFAVVVPFLSIETPPRQFRALRSVAVERIRNFFARSELHSGTTICGHNINVYDRPILARHGMPLPDHGDVVDTLALHHIVESELPHDLGYLGSRFTDAKKWKPGSQTEWDSDAELHSYCALDCVICARLAPTFARRVRDSHQIQVYESDVELQRLAGGMHRAGMRIDPGERMRHGARLREQMAEHKLRAESALGRSINLRSPDQVRALIYDEFGVDPPGLETESGDPSTSKDAIYEILQSALPDHVVTFLEALLDYRRAARSLDKDVEGLEIGLGGRVYPFWNATSVLTGRMAASDPNVCNIPATRQDPDSLRSMYVAGPGNLLVSADLEQAELRTISAMCGDEIWLDAFERGLDVHKLNASVFFEHGYDDVQPHHRDFAKCVAAGTRVWVCQRGLIRIEDLGEAPVGKATRVLTPVVTPGGPATATVFYNGGVKSTITIKTRYGRTITGTPNHRIMVAGKWKRLDRIRRGDTPDQPPALQDWPASLVEAAGHSLDSDLAWLLGAIQGDGSMTTYQIRVVGLPADGVVAEAAKIIARKFKRPAVYIRREKGCKDLAELSSYSHDLRTVLDATFYSAAIGTACKKLFVVPEQIWQSPLSVVLSYLAGLFDTDGCVSRESLELSAKNENFLVEIQLLLLSLGSTSRIRRQKSKLGVWFSLKIKKPSVRALLDLGLRLRCRRKRRALAEMVRKTGFGGPKTQPDAVISIKRSRAPVYDLCVPGAECFTAGGFVNHNTLIYMFAYGGQPKKAVQVMRRVVDAKRSPPVRPYANFSLREAEVMRARLLRAHPNLEEWWARTIKHFKTHRELRDPVLGRVRYFLDAGMGAGDDEVQNELRNYMVQCVPGFVRVLTRDGYIPIQELVGKRFEAWTGDSIGGWAPATAVEKGKTTIYGLTIAGSPEYGSRQFQSDGSHKLRIVGGSKFTFAGKIGDIFRDLSYRRARFVFGKNYHDQWRRVDDLCAGDKVLISKAETIEFGCGLSEREAELAGKEQRWKYQIPEEVWRSSVSARRAYLRGLGGGLTEWLDRKPWEYPQVSYESQHTSVIWSVCILARTVGVPLVQYGHAAVLGAYGDTVEIGKVESYASPENEQPVYTLIVDHPSHSYVADGFISHNSSIGSIMGGKHACGAAMRSIGWPWYGAGGLGGPGLIHHGYDSMMAEVSADRVEEAKRALEEAMTFDLIVDGRKIRIYGKAKAGLRWSSLE